MSERIHAILRDFRDSCNLFSSSSPCRDPDAAEGELKQVLLFLVDAGLTLPDRVVWFREIDMVWDGKANLSFPWSVGDATMTLFREDQYSFTVRFPTVIHALPVLKLRLGANVS